MVIRRAVRKYLFLTSFTNVFSYGNFRKFLATLETFLLGGI